jgi:hypothetical protein
MTRTTASRLATSLALVSLVVIFTTTTRPILGDDAETPTKKTAVTIAVRLPNHYAKVVTEKQRAQIYKIQEEYLPKIKSLESRLESLKKERDEKIAALLTPEQKKQIEETKAQAKRKS